jgi:hypothetical protein
MNINSKVYLITISNIGIFGMGVFIICNIVNHHSFLYSLCMAIVGVAVWITVYCAVRFGLNSLKYFNGR